MAVTLRKLLGRYTKYIIKYHAFWNTAKIPNVIFEWDYDFKYWLCLLSDDHFLVYFNSVLLQRGNYIFRKTTTRILLGFE